MAPFTDTSGNWIPRALAPTLSSILKTFPAVLITGPRQSGKSSLLSHELPDALHFNLDRVSVRERIESNLALLSSPRTVILDEVQKMPQLFEELKAKIDAERTRKGAFALTGSEQFHLMRGVSDSLAGRIALQRLYPLSAQELLNAGHIERSPSGLQLILLRGGYPECWGNSLDTSLWRQSYLDTYVERDVRAHFGVQQCEAFYRFLRLLAARAGQLLNMSELARDCHISQPTAREWLSILERSYIISVVYPWHSNLGKRYVKMPKVYFIDNGLLAHLLGLPEGVILDGHPMMGQLMENFIFTELIKRLSLSSFKASLFFYRTTDGAEVDFIVEQGMYRLGIEVKSWGTAPKLSELRALNELTRLGVIRQGVVLSQYPDVAHLAEHIEMRPWWNSGLESLQSPPATRN